MSSIIYTQKDKCRGCYACIRGCPCKAIKVKNSLAEVMPNLCINCGTCVRLCAPKAKLYEIDIELVRSLLASDSPVIAVLSSAFPAAVPDMRPGQFVAALKRLGFSEVMECFGSELIYREYARLLREKKDGLIFSSTCPAFVTYIEKFHPQMVEYLAPIVSPMIASGKLIKQAYNPKAKVVFIGPCVATKAERKDENVAGIVDAVLTFPEITEMLITDKISPQTLPDEKFSGPEPNSGRLFANSLGLLRTMGYTNDIMHSRIINAHGRDLVLSLLAEINQGKIDTHFVNFFFCHGCINGPAMNNNLSIFHRRELVAKFAALNANPEQTKKDLNKYTHIDLRRKFNSLKISLPSPSEKKIEDVLKRMGKSNLADRFNCGACGYRTCWELATAVARNQAETNMCWPHLLTELQETQEGLIQAEKLSSLGQMAASIAHEVNNPLSGVLVYTQLLNKKISNGNFSKDAALSYLNKMESELTRSTRLVRDLLDFARQSPPALKETDLNDVVKRSLELVVNSAQLLRIKIIKELNPALPRFKADPDQLQQVCINLILNAIQSMPKGGNLTLRTSEENEQIKLEVQDTGCGISQENMQKLFTPFFTTKKEVKGVGLGLAVSYGIVQRHRGKISVKSNEGEGTTFTITLPMNYAEKN